MREFPEMGVSIDHSLVRTLRHIFLIVYMSMSQKIALASVYQQGIGLHDREIEEHLVYFRIAVATHSDNLTCQRIQSFYDTLRIDSFRNAVAGTVVDDIPHDAHHVTMFSLEEIEDLFQGWQTAVDI